MYNTNAQIGEKEGITEKSETIILGVKGTNKWGCFQSKGSTWCKSRRAYNAIRHQQELQEANDW